MEFSRRTLMAAAGLGAVGLTAGCGGGGATAAGVTGNSVRLGMATPLSGNASSMGTDGERGAKAFLRWLNDQGGIGNRKLELVSQDDGYDLQKKVTTLQYLIQNQNVFAVWADVGSHAVSGGPLIAKEKVPYLFPYSLNKGLAQPVQRYVFLDVPMADTQEHILSNYMAKSLGKDARIGFLVLNSADGQEAVAGFKAGKAGPQLVAEQKFERTATTWNPQLVALKQAGVTAIVSHASDVWTAKMLNEARSLGMNVTFYASSGAVTPGIFELAGKDVMEGTHAVAITAPIDATDITGVKEFVDAMAKYDPGYTPGAYALHSWGSGLIVAEAMRRVKGDLTREALVDALETMKDFDAKGITAPVTFTKDNHVGVDKVMIVKAQGGKWVPVTPFIGKEEAS